MGESNALAAWDHTASLLCLIFNTNRGPKQRAASIEDFHPLRERRKRAALTVDALHSLRSMFD